MTVKSAVDVTTVVHAPAPAAAIRDPDGDPILDPTPGFILEPAAPGASAAVASAVDVTTTVDGTSGSAPTLAITSSVDVTTTFTVVVSDEQTIDMAGAIRGPVAYGPRITQPGTVTPPIVARLFRLRDHRTPIATLDQSFNRTWQEQIGDAGSGSLSLLNDDPDLALVRDGDVIRFELHGEYAFSFVVTDRQKTTIAAGEEHDEVTVLSGPGLLAWLTRSMLIYPARQPPQLLAGPIAERVIQQDVVDENRTFSWASYDMLIDADRYVPVANLGNMEVTPPGWPPGLTVDRIGPPDSTAENTPPGIVYYRFGFEVTDTEAEIFLWSPARDPLTIWVDGSLMDDSDGGVEEDEVRNVSVSTAATGDTTHNISVAVNHQGEGVGWIAVLGLGVNEDGDYTGSSVMTSNAGWLCIPYPPEPPPVTAMAVLTAAVGEMNSRRYNPQLGFVGGEEVDAGGTPWPPLPEITTKVGTTVWDFLQEMAPFVEVWMGANPRQLWVWVAGKRATEVNVNLHGVTDPTDTQSGNLRGLVHRRAT